MGRIADAFKRATGADIARPLEATHTDGTSRELFSFDQSPSVMTDPWRFADERERPRQEAVVPTAPPDGGLLSVTRPKERRELSADALTAKKLLIGQDLSNFAREQYRRLGAILHDAQLERGVKVVMVTSALAEEGKTLTAANLALTLDDSFRRDVGLVEADLRRPTMHQLFDLNGNAVATSALTSNGPLPMAQVRPRLAVLALEGPVADPLAALSSERMRQVLEAARARFEWVVVDTPPVGLVPDGTVLASMVDAIVLVVSAGRTSFSAIRQAVDALGVERVVGVVLNRADGRACAQRASGHHDYYGGALYRRSGSPTGDA